MCGMDSKLWNLSFHKQNLKFILNSLYFRSYECGKPDDSRVIIFYRFLKPACAMLKLSLRKLKTF